MSVFGIRWLKNTPISETVGNGLCAVPGTFRVELRQNQQVPVRHCTKASLGGSWLALWARLMRAAGRREMLQKQWAQRYSARRGRLLAARHVSNITCVVECYCPIYGTPNVAAMIHRQATWQLQPVRMNGTTPRHVIPRERKRVEESSQVADFTLRRLFLQLEWIPPLR